MKCPYCQNETIEGVLSSHGEIFWIENKERSLLQKVLVSERLFGFGKESISYNANIQCYRCMNCKKIIIDEQDQKDAN